VAHVLHTCIGRASRSSWVQGGELLLRHKPDLAGSCFAAPSLCVLGVQGLANGFSWLILARGETETA
jgi:hypothetical protein